MTSMTATPQHLHPGVIGGVDCHADTHSVAALDSVGRALGAAQFPTTSQGYRDLESWLRQHGEITAIGVESTSGYGAALTRHLHATGLHVVEVNQPHPRTRARRGKNDSVDAEMAARKVLSGEVRTVPKDTSGVVEAIRQLKVARSGAVKARAAALVTLGQLIITAPATLREQLDAKTLPGRAAQAARLRPDLSRLGEPGQAVKFALRSVARQIQDLSASITELDQALAPLVDGAALPARDRVGYRV